MLKKRIIPCLDIKNGRTVKGINFFGLRDAGDPLELAKKYEADGADELVFLDISATEERRATLIPLVEKMAHYLSIPFTVGGGIQTTDDVSRLLKAGADKVSINTAAVKRPALIKEIADAFGSQCTVLAVDSKQEENGDTVYVKGGKERTALETLSWIQKAIELGAGEILLTSMDKDGTKSGFDIRLLQKIAAQVSVPIIASGGAGSIDHFTEVFTETKATGGLAASIFHFGEIPIPILKKELHNQQIAIRCI